MPLARCIEGRTSRNASQCYAHFGYLNTDAYYSVSRPYPTEGYNLVSVACADGTPCTPEALATPPPSEFAANASAADAFRVPMPCAHGAAAVWTLGDGLGHFLEAAVYADSSPPCESFVAPSETLSKVVSVFVDSPCVQRSGSTCEAAFGYNNPNAGAAAYFVPPAQGSNEFRVDGQASSPAPPSVLYPQRVREAYLLRWPCPAGSEAAQWTLRTAGVVRTAVASPLWKVCP